MVEYELESKKRKKKKSRKPSCSREAML